MSPQPVYLTQIHDQMKLKELVESMRKLGLDHTVLFKAHEPIAICITLIPTELESAFTSAVADFVRRNKQ